VNGIEEGRQLITLNPGGTQTVTFEVKEGTAGTYSVDVNGVTGSFVVQAKPAASPTPTQTPPVTPSKPVTFNWLFAGIAVVAVVLIAVIVVWTRSRRKLS